MVKMDELQQTHKALSKGEVILDVRGPDEFAEAHVPGAINIAHDQVHQHVDRLRTYDKVYIHCRSGKRAGIAMEALQKAGLKNLYCIDDSGMEHWVQKGYPVERG